MRIKQFYINHKPLFQAVLGLILLTAVLLFWPRPAVVKDVEPVEPPQIKMEAPEPILSRISESTPAPTPTPTPEPEPPRYGFTEDEIYLMAVLLSGSKYVDGDGEFDIDYGRDEEYDQISLVLGVVMNRVRSENWQNTVSEVIWQKGQFSAMPQWKKGLPEVSDISLQRVSDWCKAYDAHDPGVQTIPEDHFYFTGDGRYNHSR